MLTSTGPRRSTLVTAVSRQGLDLEVDGSARFVVWSAIGSVISGMIGAPTGEMFVLALEFEIGRMVLVTESERVWGNLTEILHIVLPEMEPFSAWGARLAIAPDVLTLYERSAPAAMPT